MEFLRLQVVEQQHIIDDLSKVLILPVLHWTVTTVTTSTCVTSGFKIKLVVFQALETAGYVKNVIVSI